jgi:D-serine deaminase-like pyridoxal phosphate-dependent protein
MTQLTQLETPCLLLDRDRLERNLAAMHAHASAKGVRLRPHLKTAKSLEVAKLAVGGPPGSSGLTVSTLKEAAYFAEAGYRDLLLATPVTPNKLAHAARIIARGADLILGTDSPIVAEAAARFAADRGVRLSFVIEIDCGEHRSGLPDGDGDIVHLARTIHASPELRLRGVMTHAGHSYSTDATAEVADIARRERDVAVAAANAIRAAGLPCEIVSVGSTPTVLFAPDFEGVTEARCGIYMFWDLSQLSRHVCNQDDIAVSVLASVISHSKSGSALILDAGALALSKDLGAQKFMPEAGYGLVCDPVTAKPLPGLAVTNVHQEHGTVPVLDAAWFERLPVGSLVRVLPNHACITCAGYDAYTVVRGAEVVDHWPRINGW